MAADLILVDRSLALYGSEIKQAGGALHDLVAELIDQIYSSRGKLATRGSSELNANAVDFYQMVRSLSPDGESQKSLKEEALRGASTWPKSAPWPWRRRVARYQGPFLAVLVFWLAILFAGFGLFAPPNFTAAVTLGICALSVSAALYLILEMDHALTGLMQISIEPLRNAIAVIGR
jgi:hypothetical protein